MTKHRPNDPFCECCDCVFKGCEAYKRATKKFSDPLQDFNSLPNWLKAIYPLDPLVERIVKDWRMTKNPKEVLFERLAYQLVQEREHWKYLYEETAKNTP